MTVRSKYPPGSLAEILACLISVAGFAFVLIGGASPSVYADESGTARPREWGTTFERLDIRPAAVRIASMTNRTVAIASQLEPKEVSFDSDPVPRDELFRRFAAALLEYGYEVIEIEDVAVIVPHPLKVPPPLLSPHTADVVVDFEDVHISLIAKFVGDMSGRIIAVPPAGRRLQLSWVNERRLFPEELFAQFVGKVREAGFRVVEEGRVAAIVADAAE